MKSVVARLTTLFVLLTAVILAVFAGSLYLWVRERHSRMLAENLQVQSRLFRDRFVGEYEEKLRGTATDVGVELEEFLVASGAEGEVLCPDGRRFYASKGFSETAAGFRRDEGTVTVSSGETFVVRLAVSEEPFRLTLRQLETYFALFLPPMLGLAGVLGFFFVRRAFAPVGRIRRQAERISRANVSERVPIPKESGELRDLAQTFNEMLDRLDHAFQDLHNFAADAAHELRTPLATLRAELDTAIQRPHRIEEHEQLLASFAEEVARMNRIVSDLFTLAKIDMRQYALQKERVELASLLEEARDVWEPSAVENGIQIVREGPPVTVAGDPVALRRVFMNLIENAIKYNRRGGTIRLSTEILPAKVRVEVSDSGIGIADEDLPRLFTRFFRVDKARSRDNGGAGLGLAICKSFIEAHGGTIGVQSSLGIGTTFRIDLPLDGEPLRAAVHVPAAR